MLVVRGTKKFRDRVGRTDTDGVVPTNSLGDWYANAVLLQPHMAFLLNAATLLPVVFPLAPAATALERAPDAIKDVLIALDVDRSFVDAERAEMGQQALLPTASRSVLGVMRELIELGRLYYRLDGVTDPVELSVRLSQVPCGPLYETTVSPARLVHAGPGRCRRSPPAPKCARWCAWARDRRALGIS